VKHRVAEEENKMLTSIGTDALMRAAHTPNMHISPNLEYDGIYLRTGETETIAMNDEKQDFV
jgi:hypothetical protein